MKIKRGKWITPQDVLKPGLYTIATSMGIVEARAKNGWEAVELAKTLYKSRGVNLQGRTKSFCIIRVYSE